MSNHSRVYENFLEFRRQEKSNFLWSSRSINPQLAYKQGKSITTPAFHKQQVVESPKIQELLDEISKKQNISKSQLINDIKIILDEIGYNKKLKLIRWLSLALTKISLRVLSGILINVDEVQKIKQKMGNCPVVFVPSHRSYADFIMMSYVCFQYDIAVPAIAAGMDFQGMWGMGTMLRDTGAFFMRRSYNDDKLYWLTFKQYIYQLVTKGDLPIEFFIEGTRSRSNKSLAPKYGLILMVLKAYFLSQVPDILFVPVSINYDRILEENLFAFELLGVPKPKETTSGFFKSLKILKENFGNIYIHFSEPISCKDYFGKYLNRGVHNTSPLHYQEITTEERALIPPLSYKILQTQQRNNLLNVFNLMALVLNNNFATRRRLLCVDEIIDEVKWLKSILKILGAHTYAEEVRAGIGKALVVHKGLVALNSENQVCLVSNQVQQDKINPLKLKGHALSDKTMTYSMPFVMLQIYVNPLLQYLVDMAIFIFILRKEYELSEDKLYEIYHFLRSLLSKEFVYLENNERMEFNSVILNATNLDVIKYVGGYYKLGDNEKLQEILISNFEPFLVAYATTFEIVEKLPICEEKTILANVQKILEEAINTDEKFLHPYCLNLDTLTNCINTLSSLGIMKKSRRDNKSICETDKEKLSVIKAKLDIYILKCHLKEDLIQNFPIQHKL